MTLSPPDKIRYRPLALAIVVALGVLVGGFFLGQNLASAPIRQHITAGTQAWQRGQAAQAETEWRAAIQLDPDNAQAWELLGDASMNSQAWEQAIAAFQKLLSVAPNTPNAHGRLATAAWAVNNGKLAQEQAQLQLQQNAADTGALQVLAAVAKSYTHKEDELKYLKELARLKPQDAVALTVLAEFYTKNFDYDAAAPLLKRILALDPNSADAYMMSGLALYDQDPTPQNLQKAKTAFEKVVALNPEELEAHRYLGRVYLRLNQPRQAIREFELLGRGRPYASAHFLELAKAYRQAGDEKTADKLQKRFTNLKQLNRQMQNEKDAVARDPNDFAAQLQLGVLLWQTVIKGGDGYELYRFRYAKQDLKAADYYLEKARLLRPQSDEVKTSLQNLERSYANYLQVGLQALQERQLRKADENLSRAVLLRPEDARTKSALQQAFIVSSNADHARAATPNQPFPFLHQP